MLDRNKLNSSLSCQTQFAKRIIDKLQFIRHHCLYLTAVPTRQQTNQTQSSHRLTLFSELVTHFPSDCESPFFATFSSFKQLMARELRSNFQIPENFEFPEVLPRTRRQERKIADTNAAPADIAVPETWHINPYRGKLNHSTKAGQAIFENKTKGLPADERFTATKKDSQGICRLLQVKSSSLGAVVTRVPQ